MAQADSNSRVDVFIRACRERGLKVTHQRMEIFRALASSSEHPDAERLYRTVAEIMPSISRDTVYRTLATLEAQGFVSKVEAGLGSVRYDANQDRHHHFVCRVCGSITDFHCEALDVLPVPKSVDGLGRVESAHVQVRGTCANCTVRENTHRQGSTGRIDTES